MNYKKEFKKMIRTPFYMRAMLYVSGIISLICIVIILFEYFKMSHVEIYEMTKDTKPGTYVYVDISLMSVNIEYDDNDNIYRQITDINNEEYIILVGSNEKKFEDIINYTYSNSNDVKEPDTIRVYGYAENIKKKYAETIAYDFYRLSTDDFYKCFGHTILNTERIHTTKIMNVFAIILGFAGVFLIGLPIILLGRYVKVHSMCKEMESSGEIGYVVNEYYNRDRRFDKFYVYFTEHYVIGNLEPCVIKLNNIAWVYTVENNSNVIHICTYDNKKHALIGETNTEIVNQILRELIERCEGVIVGDSTINSREYGMRLKTYMY